MTRNHSDRTLEHRPRCSRRSRRGAAVIIVLTIVALCMAMAYASMRSQFTMVQVQRNGLTQGDARHAALTGLSVALRQMHQSDWAGVGTSLAAELGDGSSYSVTYTTGDPALEDPASPGSPDASHPDYQDWPFRVTVFSTGTASNDDSVESTYRVRAVMRLVPRALSAEPADWDKLDGYTLYQYRDSNFYFHPHVRVEGAVRLRKKFEFAPDFNWDVSTRNLYLSDLLAMDQAGYSLKRMFTGPIDLPYSEQGASDSAFEVNEIQTLFGVTTNDAPKDEHPDIEYTDQMNTYRIYPGGKLYSVPEIGGSASADGLGADPDTNPAGIYYFDDDVEFQNNDHFIGSLIANKKIQFIGSGVQLSPVSLPPLCGTTAAVQLPVVSAQNDIEFWDGFEGALSGLITTKERFNVDPGVTGVDLSFEGRLIFKEFKAEPFTLWPTSEASWDLADLTFKLQKTLGGLLTDYFPGYLASTGKPFSPIIKLKPSPEPVRYHWPTDGGSIYVIHADDPGLLWEMIDWQSGI